MSGKPLLDELELITATRVTIISKSSHRYKKGKYPVLITNTKSQQLIKQTKTSYSIAALLFRKMV